MRSKSLSFTVDGEVDVNKFIRDVDFMLSIIPYQVARGRGFVTLQFRRFGIFSFRDKFYIEVKNNANFMTTYIFRSLKNNRLELVITLENTKENKTFVDMSLTYVGEREWIVGKYLDDILGAVKDSLMREVEKVEETKAVATTSTSAETSTSSDTSRALGKMSFLTKLLMKSKLATTEEIDIPKGQFTEKILELIKDYLKYRLIYVSGVSPNMSFRVLLINGDVKGVYTNEGGQENYGEDVLNRIEGHFKVNIYVSLEPEEVLKILEAERH